MFLFINATAYETAIHVEEGVSQDGFDEAIRDAFKRLDPASIPNTMSMLGVLTSGGGEARFRFGLRLMIEGLLHVPPPNIAS